MNGMRKAHQMKKIESKYLLPPDSLLGFSSLPMYQECRKILKVIKAFLADIKRTMVSEIS